MIFHRFIASREEEEEEKRTKGRQRQSEFRVEIHAIPAIKRSNEVARRYQKTETRFLRERGVQTERSAGNTVPRHRVTGAPLRLHASLPQKSRFRLLIASRDLVWTLYRRNRVDFHAKFTLPLSSLCSFFFFFFFSARDKSMKNQRIFLLILLLRKLFFSF